MYVQFVCRRVVVLIPRSSQDRGSARVCKSHHVGPRVGALFLVACYATLHPAMAVRWSVGWSVGRSPFYFFGDFLAFLAYGSCPDALVTFSSTAPAHPHATRVAVYLALL